MRVLFFIERGGKKAPVYEYIKKLDPRDRLRVLACLKNVEELGLKSPRVQYRHIRGKLWELKIRLITQGCRIFYVVIKQDRIVLLHAYKKESQKAPQREISIAEKRLKEVIKNEEIYNT